MNKDYPALRNAALLRSWPALMVLGALPSLLFALLTNHAWEDWYITYRAGKNLALGNGLVYEPGQVLHTFTSPLNALVPAALSWLLGNGNDPAVLWLYRVIGAVFLGGTVVLLHRLAVNQQFDRRARLFLLALFLIDGKIMDFSVNGQEAAFLVFFSALMLNGLFENKALWLGIAWAGLMWSRPDSFVSIGATALGFLLAGLLRDRASLRGMFRLYSRAALLAILLYGPWIAWTNFYYGTPLPHTVVAKALGRIRPLPELLAAWLRFPWDGLVRGTALEALFMPPYYYVGGWPNWMIWLGQWLAWIAAVVWILPRVGPLVRVCSLGTFIGASYLTIIAPICHPWYLPPVQVLTMVTLAALLSRGLERWATRVHLRRVISGLALLLLVFSLSLTLMMSWQLRVQQRVIEDGNRKQIGLWLKQQAGGRRETVFVECLGYFGFYSNLKMYDYPGMSSPEMVAARRRVGNDWVALIRELRPDWVVLRPVEAERMDQQDGALLTRDYLPVALFDQSETLRQYGYLPGRAYLESDATFMVFRRQYLAIPPL